MMTMMVMVIGALGNKMIVKMSESGLCVRKTQDRMVLEGHRWRAGRWFVLPPTTILIFHLLIRRRLKEQNRGLQIGRVSVVDCRYVIVCQGKKSEY
jgi:hypothetical protein